MKIWHAAFLFFMKCIVVHSKWTDMVKRKYIHIEKIYFNGIAYSNVPITKMSNLPEISITG